MLGVLGDSVLIGLTVTVFLLISAGLWYTVGVRVWYKFQDKLREADDDVKQTDRYESPRDRMHRK